MIRPVRLSDAQFICDIYNEYIENSTITFEEIPVSLDDMMERIENVIRSYPWLVYEVDKEVVGYIYGRMWRERAAYRNSVEAGLYLRPDFIGKGIGSEMMDEILKTLKEKSFHTVISGIALPNPASVALCEKFGFTKVAHFKEVGYKFNKWIDVGYWQLIL
ncbi:MAG: N-acetyltransferase family protein [Candidatus Kryptoniota bacterium]